MKKGQTGEGYVERMDFPNKGIVKSEEGTCVVKNALPGQKVSFRINKVRKGKAEGRLLEILEPSPTEQKDSCPHFGICGGCTYISLPYEEQTAIKQEQVRKLLDAVLKPVQPDWKFEEIKPSPCIYGYRNKMEFSFGDEYKDGPLSLGMHKRGSFYDVVTVSNCRIVDADYRNILQCTLDFFRERQIPFYHRMKQEGYLRHLLVRKAAKTGEILIALITTTQTDGFVGQEESTLLEAWKDKLEALSLDGRITGVLHTINDSVADIVQSDETILLSGRDYFVEELLGLQFKISQFSFFQTNSYGAEVLYQTARDYIGSLGGKDKTVYDLYSGTGTIAQLMAPVAGKVIGVEIVEEAVDAAKENARLNGLDNCEFIAGDVLKVLDSITEKPDMIILDPPRDGIHPKALTKILAYGVEHLVYISCKPTSLARDLEAFLEQGYRVERVTCVDQFPWTANVETICSLRKQKTNL
ncbi:MAG: 23S rRNA (uracil(1939)-C(5))-methyltransferase RlmD [Lachnospiraceae bacterium]|nr:23S rRNA (uracil(1939)-C(5))-methyltransferase RlmD [Lachnospiraceae bacterium]